MHLGLNFLSPPPPNRNLWWTERSRNAIARVQSARCQIFRTVGFILGSSLLVHAFPQPRRARPRLQLQPQPACASLTFGVQRSETAAAGAGPGRLQEARPSRRPRAHRQQPEGPQAGPGRRLQQLPERRGRRGDAEACGRGAQGAGQAAQHGEHSEDNGSSGAHVRVHRTTWARATVT